MREFYKGSGARGPAHFPRCSLYWATATVGLIRRRDSFQQLHDEEAAEFSFLNNHITHITGRVKMELWLCTNVRVVFYISCNVVLRTGFCFSIFVNVSDGLGSFLFTSGC